MTIAVANVNFATHNMTFLVNRVNELADALSNKVLTVESNTTSGNISVNGALTANIIAVGSALRGGNLTSTSTLTFTSNASLGNQTLSFADGLISFGNSTVNATANSTTLKIGVSNINQSLIFVGNSTVNTSINSTAIAVQNSVASIVLRNAAAAEISSGNYYLNANGSWVDIGISVTSPSVTTTGTTAQLIDSFNKTTYRTGEYILSIKDNSANAFQAEKVLVVHYDTDVDLIEYGVIITNSSLGVFTSNSNTTHVRLYFTPTPANTTVKYSRVLVSA